ncbi:MAG TPA: type I restriction-modification system subunit M [Candidatus Krumholzibacteria bacterium]|nr:type I restriction-modification system subunit M [Candidatus Krumholzibacteria bacterium]HRY42050.1 type I restriction-modification system subunit M [Candidatus Krumholzibacteria bacterium]
MAHKANTQEVFNAVWRACDTFRGAIDPSEYKNYILTTLFVKYLSDLARDKREQYEKSYKGDMARVDRAMSRERFVLPTVELRDKAGKIEETFPATFDALFERRDRTNIGEIINIALEHIEDANKSKLENVFRNIDFNSEPALGQTRDRNRRLKNLLNDFVELDLRPSHLEGHDVIGDVYQYLIERFAANAGKKAGEFFTPPEISTLLSRLLAPKTGDRICDPTCGSGSLLIKVGREIGSDNFHLAGQESNGSTWALCKMNMFLHEVDSARIEWCDTLNNPRLIEGDELMRFNVVVANPPFSLDKWGQDHAENDPYHRFDHWGIPPKSRGDYAFIIHMVEITLHGEGRVGVVVPHGVLFRGGAEGTIRRKLVGDNFVEAVIGLPPNLFYGTGIPAALLLLNKGKKTQDVLFIDASREFEQGTNQNKLQPQDIEKIVSTFRDFKTVNKYAYRASLDEIAENDFNLNIARYVDTFEEEREIDVATVQREIDEIESKLANVRVEMAGYLKGLGYGS